MELLLSPAGLLPVFIVGEGHSGASLAAAAVVLARILSTECFFFRIVWCIINQVRGILFTFSD